LIEPTNRNKYGFNSIKSANTTIIPSISIHCESSKIILGTCMKGSDNLTKKCNFDLKFNNFNRTAIHNSSFIMLPSPHE
ncbi:MAG: hypothetical protein ACYDEC_13375, partial [Bacteroidia bacterium]